MAVLIHVKDDVCCADANIFSKLVRTPHGKPLDLQVDDYSKFFMNCCN